MTPDRAEELALRALAHIAGSEDLGPVFLGATGIGPRDLMATAGNPETLIAVLDFLTMDDSWIEAFCTEAGYGPTDPMTARSVLAGPSEMHWT